MNNTEVFEILDYLKTHNKITPENRNNVKLAVTSVCKDNQVYRKIIAWGDRNGIDFRNYD